MKVVTPQQQTLFEFGVDGFEQGSSDKQFISETVKTGDVPMECQIVLSNKNTGQPWMRAVFFDALSLVSP